MDNELELQSKGKINFGTCRYCGQGQVLSQYVGDTSEADEIVTSICDCDSAESERRMTQRVYKGRELITKAFGMGAEEQGFIPVSEVSLNMLYQGIEVIARGYINKLKLSIPKLCTAQISMNSKGLIVVQRTEGTALTLSE